MPTIPVAEEEHSAPSAPAPTELEKVVVTATKREKSVRELDGTVGAISRSALTETGARGLEDELKLVPGVSLNKEMADRNDPSIRGIATETRFQSTQRATGIYIDEIPMSDPFIPISQPDLASFDLQRIEVMKGPQGTLFGSTALAGAIHYITQKPAFGHFSGQALGSVSKVADGERGPFSAGMLNVPIGESAALRGVLVRRDDPGFIDDTRTGQRDIGGLRQRHARVEAAWEVAAPLNLSASWLRQEGSHKDSPFADQRDRREHGNTYGPSPTSSEFGVGNFVASYDASWGHVVTSTSRLDKEAHLRLEASRVLGTGASTQPLYTTADTQANGYTEELRLVSPGGGRLEWLFGGWWQRYDSTYDQYVLNPGEGPEPPPDRSSDATELVAAHSTSSGQESAVFGDATYKVLQPWSISAGGRYYRVELHTQNINTGTLSAASTGTPTQVLEADLAEHAFNPRLGTALRFGDHLRLHALASKGFRFGGVQLIEVSLPGTTPPPRTFKSDHLWSYEGGVRTDWFDGEVTFDVTLFRSFWKDLQVTQLDPTGLTTFVTNIGAARTQGTELAFSARPFAGVHWTTAAAFIDARTTVPFQTTGGTVPPETCLPGTPKTQFTNVLGYEGSFGSLAPGFSLVHSHIGPSYNDLFGTEELGGYDTIDVRGSLGLSLWRVRPELVLALQNVTDARGVAGAFATPTGKAHDFYFITPRTLSLTTSLSF